MLSSRLQAPLPALLHPWACDVVRTWILELTHFYDLPIQFNGKTTWAWRHFG